MMNLGIDIAKDTIDVTLIDDQGNKHHATFKNNKKGFGKLLGWLKKHQVEVDDLHICMEATNIYWEDLALYLHSKGYKVSVVNPVRVKGFATSQLRRNKTDKEDSEIIADFCAAMKPDAWTPPNDDQRKLRALVRHLEGLKKTLTQQKNRLASCKDKDVRCSLQIVIDALKKEIASVEQQIKDLIKSKTELKKQYDLLTSIKGFGPQTTYKLMAEMYDLANYESASAAAADAGLNPSHHESGTSVKGKPRLSKIGKAAVRTALYLPALTAMRWNPLIQAFAKRLEAKGKHTMVIIAAVMRKLLHIAYGVLKNRKAFDPEYSH